MGWSTMRRCAVLVALLALFAASAAAQDKAWRVGLLAAGNPRTSPQWVAFDERLRELGYVEGRNIRTEFRDGEGRADRFAVHAADLVGRRPDLIVVAGPEALFAAVRQATATLSIVMIAVDFDPVAAGYVASLARPGGNFTGLTLRQTEVAAKRLELLKEMVPGLARVAVLGDAFSRDQVKAVADAASALNLQLHAVEFSSAPYDFESALRDAVRAGAGAALVSLSPEIFRERARIASIALDQRLPTTFPLREFAAEGGLMSFGVNFPRQWRRAAEFVDKVLKGARPAELPVEQPTTFELVINQRSARALGVTFPDPILARADETIE